MLLAGVARTDLTPFWGVELTGWGYYIGRRWQRIHDPLYATALAFDDEERHAVLLALDLMVIDESFTRKTRDKFQEATGLQPEAILLTCSHSHNAPAAGGLLGVGECDPLYEDWASRQAATAAILAWQQREPVSLRCGHSDLTGLTFNRTRLNGQVDPRVTALRVDRRGGSPLAVVVNFGAHPTVMTELRPSGVSRDVPGEVCDGLEAALPGATALYIQGACGDVNFLREFSAPERCHEPAKRLVDVALQSLNGAFPMANSIVASASQLAVLPTRRWTREELENDRRDAERRLATGDVAHWRETIGRAMTNRPDDMVKRHGGDEAKAVRAMCRFQLEWTERMLRDFETRPQVLATEVQALRIGDLYCVANSSEFFSPFAHEIRRQAAVPELMLACYANGRIGYLPDEHDITARSYAGYQSPKYCNQFPFTRDSGPAMCDAMLAVIERCRVE
jgi:neutral ceramidase